MIGRLMLPAAVFMNRLRYPAKFSLIGLMFLLPFAVVMFYFLAEVDNTISFARAERRGVAVDTHLMRLYADLLRYRDRVLAHDPGALRSVDADIDAGDTLGGPSGPNWPGVKRDWRSFGEGVASADKPSTYDHILSGIVGSIADVGLQSKLLLDPETASYCVMDSVIDQEPDLLLESMRVRVIDGAAGSGRPYGMGAIQRLSDHLALVTSTSQAIAGDVHKAAAADPDLSATLEPLAGRVEDSASLFGAAVSGRGNIVLRGAPPAVVDEAAGSLFDATLAYHAAAAQQLDAILLSRLHGAESTRLAVCAFAAASFLLAAYLFGGFYVGSFDGMRRLVGTAQRVAHGGSSPTESGMRPDEIGRLAADLEALVKDRTEELIQARNAAESANAAKSQFLANMSHELRTPLNAVLGFSSLMQSDPDVPTSHRESLDIINRSGEHLLALINEVLDVARIEAGHVTVDARPFDLIRLIGNVVGLMRLRSEEKGLELNNDLGPDIPCYVRSDGAKIRQILINLVGNAVKFTHDGSITLRSRGAAGSGCCLLTFDVVDTGIGIELEEQSRIFEPFVQLSPAADRKGTGLGLAITKHYVELLGGTISVSSTLGEGTTVTASIPVTEAAESDVPVAADRGRNVHLAPGYEGIRVLIVEDQIENSLLMERLLSRAGFEARTADDGSAGVAMFAQWRPQFIWMDRRMPVMDGIEATKQIRALPDGKLVKIAGLSASTLADQRAEALAAGMDDFVGKPFRPDDIFDCMSRHLDLQYEYSIFGTGSSSDLTLSAVEWHLLPTELTADLRDALIELDAEHIGLAVDRIAAFDPDAASVLRDHSAMLSYSAMLSALPKRDV